MKKAPADGTNGNGRVLQDCGYLRTIVDSVMEPILIIDRTFTIRDANDAACKKYRQTREELVGQHCYEVSHHCSVACSQSGLSCPVTKAFEKGGETRDVHQHKLPDGTPVWEEEIISPLRDAGGNIVGVIQELRDITALLKSREVIDQLKKDLRMLKGLLPTCASCKKIRNERGEWEDMENYIRQRSEADFSHGFCEDCMRKLYDISPEQADDALKPRG